MSNGNIILIMTSVWGVQKSDEFQPEYNQNYLQNKKADFSNQMRIVTDHIYTLKDVLITAGWYASR